MPRNKYCGDHGPDATGVFGAETAGRIVAPAKRGTVTGAEADAPSGDCRHLAILKTGIIHPANAPRSCSELTPRYRAALSRRIRGSYTIRPVITAKIGPDCGGHPPRDCGELTSRYRAAKCRHSESYPHRVRGKLAPRYRRRDNGQRNWGISTIRSVGHENGGIAGSIRPVTERRNRGSWRPVSAP
jgi:hypothetical protein